MSNKSKILFFSIVFLFLPVFSFSATAEDIRNQINQLLEEIKRLQSELSILREIPSGFSFTRNLKLNMTGEDVKYLQILLNRDSETRVSVTGPGSPGQESNFYGVKTFYAVEKFQEKYRAEILTPYNLAKGTGYVGPSTITKLNSMLLASSLCGDGIIQGSEVCDAGNLNSKTCQSLGFSRGNLSCSKDCLSFITSGCSSSYNNPPILRFIGNKTVYEGSVLSFSVSASDPDGDALSYSASGLPLGAVFENGNFSWTPNYQQAGAYSITFKASDGRISDEEKIFITVSNAIASVNRAPILSAIGNKTVYEGSVLSFSVSASDPDGDALSYSASGLPLGSSFSGRSFSWTSPKKGSYEIIFTVSDGRISDSETVEILINEKACQPLTCASLAYSCGSHSDGCGGILSCGSCSSGYSCISGKCNIASGGYYVDPVSGLDSNTGDANAPFKTVSHALSKAKGGDIIVLNEGKYPHLSIRWTTGFNDWVTLRGINREKVIFEDGISLGGAYANANFYLKFEDLTIKSNTVSLNTGARKVTNTGIWALGADTVALYGPGYLTFNRCHFDGSGRTQDATAAFIPGWSHVYFDECEIEGWTVGISSSGRSLAADIISDIKVENSHIYNISRVHASIGLALLGKNVIIRGNNMHECGSDACILLGSGCVDCVIRDNIIHGAKVPLDGSGDHPDCIQMYNYGDPSVGPNMPFENVLIENNVMWDSDRQIIHWGGIETPPKNIVLKNNIMDQSMRDYGWTMETRGAWDGSITFINNTTIGRARMKESNYAINNNLMTGLESTYTGPVEKNAVSASSNIWTYSDFPEGENSNTLISQSKWNEMLSEDYHPLINSIACNGTVNGKPGAAIGARDCVCSSNSQCQEVYGSNYSCNAKKCVAQNSLIFQSYAEISKAIEDILKKINDLLSK